MIAPLRLLVVAVLLAAACSPGRFEDLQNRAWSDSNSAPEGVTSEVYPVAIAPLSTELLGVHLVVAGSNPPAIATVSYDAGGGLTAAGIPMPDVAVAVRPTLAAVVDPRSSDPRWVAAGGLGTGTIQIYNAGTGAGGPTLAATIDDAACGGTTMDLGREMMWIRTALGDAGIPDLVAVSGRDLVAFPDLAPATTAPSCVRCTMGDDVGGVTAADVLPAVGAELLVARHDPAGTAPATIAFFSASTIAADNGRTCFTSGSSSFLPGTTPDDGTLVVAGDLDDDGRAEVVFTAPSTTAVSVHPGVTASGPSGPRFGIAVPAPGGTFGAAIAIGDLDGDGRAELIVGDPDADPTNRAAAGSAFVFGVDGAQVAQQTILYKAPAAPGDRFGGVMAVARFLGASGETDLLVTGVAGRLVVYFRALPSGVDPRVH